MKKRVICLVLISIMWFVFLIPKQTAQAANNYMDSQNAKYFLAFIYNSNVSNFTDETLANDIYYKLLTGQLSNNQELEYIAKTNFYFFMDARIRNTLSNTGTTVNSSREALIKYFSNNQDDYFVYAFSDIFKDNIVSSAYTLCGYDGEIVSSVLGSLLDLVQNPKKYADDVLLITNALLYSYGQNIQSLYLYYNAALSWAGYDDEIYDTAMNANKLALMDMNFMSSGASMLIPGMTHWTEWIDQLDYWAKYAYGIKNDILSGRPKYTITFNSNCSEVSNIVKSYSTSNMQPEFPTISRPYYKFAGWYHEPECINLVTDFTIEDHTFYAKWEEIYYTITWDANCDQISNQSITYIASEGNITPLNLVRENYRFAGWYHEAECINQVTSFSYEDHTFYAKWEEIYYTITWDSNCEYIPNQSVTYKASDGDVIEAPVLTRGSHVFMGWYKDSACTEKIDSFSVKDQTFYAKWISLFDYTINNDKIVLNGLNYFEADEYGNAITDIIFPTEIDGYPVTSIGASAFSGAEITTITVPKGITTIGEKAFENCTLLKTAKILGVETLDYNVFNECSALEKIEINGTGTTRIRSALGTCNKLTEVIIGNGVARIDIGFPDHVEKIMLGNDVTLIYSLGFSTNKSLKTIKVSENNQSYSSYDGILYNKDKTVLVAYPGGKTETVFTIPEGVTEIGTNAFCTNKNLTEIKLPETLTTISNQGIYLCDSLQTLYFPKAVQTLAFNWLSALKLKEITVDKDNPYFTSVDGILYSKDMTKLVNYPAGKTAMYFAVPDTVTEIGSYGFYRNTFLENIELSNAIDIIGRTAFARCISLKSLVIPESITEINPAMFLSDNGLNYVYIPSGVMNIGFNAFNSCSSLTDIYYGGTVDAWSAVTIANQGSNSSSFASAKIHYNCIYASDMVKVYNADGVTSFEITPDEEYEGKQIICAMYNGNELSDSKVTVYEGTAIEWSSDEPFTEIKIMIWNDLVSNTPACKALEIAN